MENRCVFFRLFPPYFYLALIPIGIIGSYHEVHAQCSPLSLFSQVGILSDAMTERKFTRGLSRPGTAAQLRESVSQVVRETAVQVNFNVELKCLYLANT